MINVVFFATPQIALKSLEYFIEYPEINVQAVVTQPDKPSGRGQKMNMSIIKKCALENNIEVLQPKSIRKDTEVLEKLKSLKPDFFVTFAFGQILSQEVLDIPKYATINLHASLLPKYRGANPIQRALINGDKTTGICTMITELGLDCGDVCLKHEIEIPQDMNFVQLWEQISEISPKLLRETLEGLKNGEITPVKQSEEDATMANKLTKDEEKIDWNRSAQEIHNLVRGIYKFPGAYFEHNGKIIKVMETEIMNGSGEAGSFLKSNKFGLEIACGSGSLLLKRVKPEGKGEMAAEAWYNGVKNVIKRD